MWLVVLRACLPAITDHQLGCTYCCTYIAAPLKSIFPETGFPTTHYSRRSACIRVSDHVGCPVAVCFHLSVVPWQAGMHASLPLPVSLVSVCRYYSRSAQSLTTPIIPLHPAVPHRTDFDAVGLDGCGFGRWELWGNGYCDNG